MLAFDLHSWSANEVAGLRRHLQACKGCSTALRLIEEDQREPAAPSPWWQATLDRLRSLGSFPRPVIVAGGLVAAALAFVLLRPGGQDQPAFTPAGDPIEIRGSLRGSPSREPARLERPAHQSHQRVAIDPEVLSRVPATAPIQVALLDLPARTVVWSHAATPATAWDEASQTYEFRIPAEQLQPGEYVLEVHDRTDGTGSKLAEARFVVQR
jgi:hypothetical protein